MFIQVHSRALNLVLSFETHMPYDKLPVWRDVRQLSSVSRKRRCVIPRCAAG